MQFVNKLVDVLTSTREQVPAQIVWITNVTLRPCEHAATSFGSPRRTKICRVASVSDHQHNTVETAQVQLLNEVATQVHRQFAPSKTYQKFAVVFVETAVFLPSCAHDATCAMTGADGPDSAPVEVQQLQFINKIIKIPVLTHRRSQWCL